MGRLGFALAVCLLVLGGCAGQRVLAPTPTVTTADTASVAQADEENPFAYEWGTPLSVTPVSDELGAPPAPALPPTFQMPGLAAFPDGADDGSDAAPEENAPTDSEPRELAPVEESAPADDASPSAVAFPPPSPCAPRLRCCKKRCPCGKRAAGKCDCGKGGCGKKGGKGCCGSCRQCPCPDPCGNPCGGFVGGSLLFGPGAGFNVEFGVNFKRTRTALWSWEFGMGYQDFYDEISGGDAANSGKMRMFRAGVRARFMPCCKWHPTARAGIGWMNVTGAPELLDLAEIDGEGDYLGGYVAVGVELDLGSRWSTGPEIMVFGGWEPDGNGGTAVVPMVLWHVNYKF